MNALCWYMKLYVIYIPTYLKMLKIEHMNSYYSEHVTCVQCTLYEYKCNTVVYIIN